MIVVERGLYAIGIVMCATLEDKYSAFLDPGDYDVSFVS